jgi:protoporphyrinogen oxidase
MSIGILGGGLSGVALQSFLNQDSEILEKEERVGGLCRTFNKDGFLYDVGGHILFSKDQSIMDFVKTTLADNKNECKRKNDIFYKDRFVKYPFENGLGALDKEDIYDCLIGYLQNDHQKPTNFLEWVYYTFGNGIAEKYLVPYNKKIWKTPLDKMSLEWVERVPKPPVEDIVKSALGFETEGYVHQLYFYYPKYGGIESLIKALIKESARITTGYEVEKIRKKDRGWVVSNGKNERYYDKLVLTVPVKEAVRYLDGVPEAVLEAAGALRHNSVRVVLIGVNNESLFDKSAIYIPSTDITPHRVCYMGYFSKNNVPQGKSSLMAEITTHKGHELYDMSDGDLIQKVVDDMQKAGFIKAQDVIATDIKNLEYGYVVYDVDYHKNVKIVKDYFADIGLELHGRFAEFDYINMDEVLRRSMKLADKLNQEAR